MTDPGDRPLHRDKKTSYFAYSDKHPAQHVNSSHAQTREKSGTALIFYVCMDRAWNLGKTGHNIFEAAPELAYGQPAKEIVNWVNQKGCDLVAMSTHGHHGLADFVLGDTAFDVQHNVSVPVLLLRAR